MKRVDYSLGSRRILCIVVATLVATPVAAEWRDTAGIVRLPDLSEEAEIVRLPDLSQEEELGLPTAPVDKPFLTITTNIQPSEGNLPADDALAKFSSRGQLWHGTGIRRAWPDSEFHWEASGLYHRPLYFEDINLERHGYEVSYAQPLISAARFYCTVPAMPYLMTLDPPHSCAYTLGEQRPGSCAPLEIHKVPLRLGPAAVQVLVMTGMFIAIP